MFWHKNFPATQFLEEGEWEHAFDMQTNQSRPVLPSSDPLYLRMQYSFAFVIPGPDTRQQGTTLMSLEATEIIQPVKF